MSDSLRPHGLYSPWNSPRQNTGVGGLSLLQGIFLNPRIKFRSPALQVDSLLAEPQGNENWEVIIYGFLFVWLRDQINTNAKMIFPVLRTDEYQKILVLLYLLLYIVHIKYCSEGYDSLICILEKLGPSFLSQKLWSSIKAPNQEFISQSMAELYLSPSRPILKGLLKHKGC